MQSRSAARIRSLLLHAVPALALCACLTSCAWLTAHQSAIGQTALVVGKRAATIAVQVVVQAAVSQADGSAKGAYLDSLATGFRSYEGQVVTSDDIKSIVAAWTPDKPHWQALGDNFATLWAQYNPKTKADVAKFLEAYAQGLNTAAAQAGN